MTKMTGAGRARNTISFVIAGLLIFVSLARPVFAQDVATVSGVVHDAQGGVVSDAAVSLLNAQRAIIGGAKTDAQGRFTIPNVASGSYLLTVAAREFAERRVAINVGQSGSENIEVVVEPRPIVEEVTVTANPGLVESIGSVSQQVNVINERQIEERAKSVTAQVAGEEVGVHIQRTSPTIAGIFVRGLTGNKVNVFVDGVRYSTAAMRGGINSFLNLIDQTNLQAVEILRGPNSAQYGSDAIGGSVQFLTLTPMFSPDGSALRGKLGASFNSADASFGSNLATTYSARNFGLVTNFAGRRVNTLRTGG
ncbi:MAG TPA: TonB-dependent receptor, partial [Blastocatellia bacterium]